MGVIFMLLASASFVTMSLFIKAMGPAFPLEQLVFLRCLLALPVLLVILRAKERPLVVHAKWGLLVRTLLGMSAMHCLFYSLTRMPLADCTFIGRAQPLFLALLAPLVVGERTPRAAWLAIATGITGVALIMQPAMAWQSTAWVALAGAMFSAGAHLLVRRLNRTDYPLVIVFNFLVLTALATGIWAVPHFVPLSGRQWLLVAGVALFSSLGQLLMTTAYRRDQAPSVAAASYSS
ncbi:MAG: DMT family transporter, partial [Desulfobulbaceae bacterium]|nr:DMT family transporter [Desulfobulbaceae bacterium]